MLIYKDKMTLVTGHEITVIEKITATTLLDERQSTSCNCR